MTASEPKQGRCACIGKVTASALASLLLSLGACEPNIVIGSVAREPLLFEARHEVDQSEWTSDGSDDGYLYCPGEQAHVTHERAHSGTGSVEIGIDTADGQNPICQMLRRTPRPRAYYGAWFFIEHDEEEIGWWTLFFFKTKTSSHWDLGLYHDGYTSFAWYDHAQDQSTLVPSKPPLPIGRWFHLEAYLAYAQDEPTELEYWLDGASMLRVTAEQIPNDPALFWGLGNEASGLSPTASTLYIDDVTVSPTRLGP